MGNRRRMEREYGQDREERKDREVGNGMRGRGGIMG